MSPTWPHDVTDVATCAKLPLPNNPHTFYVDKLHDVVMV